MLFFRFFLLFILSFTFSKAFGCDQLSLNICLKHKGGVSCYEKFGCPKEVKSSMFCNNFALGNCLAHNGGKACVDLYQSCNDVKKSGYRSVYRGVIDRVNIFNKLKPKTPTNQKVENCSYTETIESHHPSENDGYNTIQVAQKLQCKEKLKNGLHQSLKNMPYFMQGKNRIKPWQTCANTSVAMVINQFRTDKQITPDDLYIAENNYRFLAQTASGAAQILKKNRVNAKSTTTGTIKDLKYHLANGRPAIVNGWFTSGGHVLVVIGYDSKTDEYIVNDPAGNWSQKFRKGYVRGSGNQTRYKAKAFEAAILKKKNGRDYYPGVSMAVASNESNFKMRAPSSFDPEKLECSN